MKSRTILNALLKESISTENCGIVNLYDEMSLGDFIRQYFCSEFHDYTVDGFNLVAPTGEYFYAWHNSEIYFGFGECFQIYCIAGQFLHICPLTDEESEEE